MREPADQVLRLPDGRRLAFRIWGDPAGRPLLFLHGTPGSRLEHALTHDAAGERGLAVITPDRWGYGSTDRPADVSLRGFAGDLVALVDHLGLGRVAIGGVSGGAPYASATAAYYPDRVQALALVSPVGPIADARCAREMLIFQRFCFTLLPHMPLALSWVFKSFRWSIAHAPRVAGYMATVRGAPADRAIMARADIAGPLLASFAEGLRPGMSGPLTDLALFARPWGFDPAMIQAPTRIWLGTDDRTVPRSAVQALAKDIPGCSFTELPGEGHLWVAHHHAQVLDWVAQKLRPGAEGGRAG